MTRPTKEEVDKAFEKLETKLLAGMETFVEDVLFREVIALREGRGELLGIIGRCAKLAASPSRYSTEAVFAERNDESLDVWAERLAAELTDPGALGGG